LREAQRSSAVCKLRLATVIVMNNAGACSQAGIQLMNWFHGAMHEKRTNGWKLSRNSDKSLTPSFFDSSTSEVHAHLEN